jgi:hypothetical protein
VLRRNFRTSVLRRNSCNMLRCFRTSVLRRNSCNMLRCSCSRLRRNSCNMLQLRRNSCNMRRNSCNMLRCSCSRLRREFRKSVECLNVRKSALRLPLLKSVLRRNCCNMLQLRRNCCNKLQRVAFNPRVLPLGMWHSCCNMLQHAAQSLKRVWRQLGRRRVYAEMFYNSVLGFQLL